PPGIRPERGDPEVLAHRAHEAVLAVVDPLDLVHVRDLVMTHSSPSSFSIAADIWTRTRAVSSGTTGYPKPVTNTPSSRRRSLKRIANAVSPTMMGTIAASPSSGSKPRARRSVRGAGG